MAREKTVAAVRDAIVAAFAEADDEPPTNETIIARSGVSSASYYRVLTQHPEVKELLDVGLHAYDLGRATDAVAENPHRAVRQLRDVVAALVQMNEQLREQLDKQQRELERLRESAPASNVRPLSRDG